MSDHPNSTLIRHSIFHHREDVACQGLSPLPFVTITRFYFILLIIATCLCFVVKADANGAHNQSNKPSCVLSPLLIPKTPAKIPAYAQLDPTTGLHVTGTMKRLNIRKYRLQVTGEVDNPLSLTINDLRCMPRTEAHLKLVCPDAFEDTATWAGAPLKHVLQLAKVRTGATGVRLIAADGYSAPVRIEVAMSDRNFLAYEWEGKALPALHGSQPSHRLDERREGPLRVS